MEITIDTTAPEKVRVGVLAVGAFTDGALSPLTRTIDEASKGKLSAIIARGDLETNAGATVLLHDLPGVAAERVILISFGKRDGLNDKALRDALASAARVLAGGAAKEAAVALTDIEVPGRSLPWRLGQASR